MITFNVIFTPGTAAPLLPFATTLLKGSDVRIRVVANGCTADEVDLLRAAARTDERIAHHVLPSPGPIEHGLALNHLFEEFPEPQFAIADSDVIASGDFMPALWPPERGEAAVFSAPPVWATDEESVLPADWRFLTGRARALHDGTPIGGTYIAIYERAALEPAWRAAPRGFGVHHRHTLPAGLRRAMDERGWHFRILDTARVINLQLLLAGHALANRTVPELHHVGGFSGPGFEGMRAMLDALPRVLRSKEQRHPMHVAHVVQQKLTVRRRRRDPRFRAMDERRRVVRAYARAAIEALAADEPVPPAPRTDSAAVDRRVAALVAALEAHYPAARARLGAAERAAA